MKDVLTTTFRILTFRATREELLGLDNRHLAFGLLCTWLVGMGRWWDDPGALIFQRLGIGSVGYVFVLSLLLWLLVLPLRPEGWRYRGVLTYVCLTAPPAALYALPVERWWGLATAANVNLWFLGVVALWRVALMGNYLRQVGRLSYSATFIGIAFPVLLTMFGLTLFNFTSGVVEIMAGLRNPRASDAANNVVMWIGAVAVYGALPVLGWYFGEALIAARRWEDATSARQAEPSEMADLEGASE